MHIYPTLINMGVRTPETQDGVLSAQVRVPILCHIKDTSDPNHVLKHEAAMKHISDNGLIFEDLKKKLSMMKI